jgi:peptidyl-prolyl cis-trans isomerase C
MGCTAREILNSVKRETVSVNGVTIPHDAIAREVQHHPAAKPSTAWRSAALALVVRELLLQRARVVGIEPAPLKDSVGRRETEEESLIRGLIELEVKTPEPDAESCRRYYERNRRLFRSPPIYEAEHILFAARRDDEEAYAKARDDAALVQAELERNPERFSELARAYSACSSGAQGGHLGQIAPGQTTPEFERALARLTPGSIGEPVETRYGVHLIRLKRKHDGAEPPYELVADRVANYLRETAGHRALAQYIARLVSSAEISGIALEDKMA